MPAILSRQERCPLCGASFHAEGQGCRPSCPMARGCRVICCPGCGYSFPQEGGVAGRLRQLLNRLGERKVVVR
ncbi:MAG TPA: hypothetical protein VMU15_18530 [Anaeromyxobacter sp.]|nr:hypothetical protein [Anaeromyxobacter sp.]